MKDYESYRAKYLDSFPCQLKNCGHHFFHVFSINFGRGFLVIQMGTYGNELLVADSVFLDVIVYTEILVGSFVHPSQLGALSADPTGQFYHKDGALN